MSESDILLIHQETMALNWEYLIWWFGMSLGLYSIAYFVGQKLNFGQLIFTVLVYLLLTFVFFNQISLNNSFAISLIDDLIALQNGGVEISNASLTLIGQYFGNNYEFIRLAIESIGIILLSIGGLAYLVYMYRKGRKAIT